ncbi:S8 family peptidase [Streptomyces xiamenensis]|uniref:S8 family peptidase n=1 Tax=Streptomyces xiamenensis TaxID=408015 RepID=UPI0037CF7119
MSKKYPRGLAAGAIAVALAAGLAAPAGAAPGDPGGPGAPDTPATTGPAGLHDLTLITGDRVLVDGEGTYRGLIPAAGRESIPVQTLTRGGETLVVPADAQALIRAGTLDERLFSVTRLATDRYRALDGLPLIVTYGGTQRVQDSAAILLADTTENRTPLDSINGEAFTVTAEETTGLWDAVTRPGGENDGAFRLAATPGIATVTLDGVVETTLAESVPQIGAPEAWQAGYDGEGVTIAVLDTGISEQHADLAGKVIAAEDFAGTGHTGDLHGHGTHVASTAAGTGAHGDGTYTGVAPGADLLNGKVLDDGGLGWESGIIAGMEWAVDQGADIINMSLGGEARSFIDPMEEAVNRLSAESGALFVIAAGNNGPKPGTIGSPGTADAALTLGSVDKSDRLASSSSVGPRSRDGALKPDVTAPGVDIAAAGAPDAAIWQYGRPVADGYVAISGTSMATPHAAGAAALLSQRHPEWTGQQIKAALTGSATGADGLTAYQQGSGRIDVAAALDQTVIAETTSLSFGAVPFPHENAGPVTRELTYRNLGDTDITLDLTAVQTGPGGSPATEDVFTLGTDRLTVPAGGTAGTEVTAHPGRGTGPGVQSLHVTASGDGQTVRTAGALDLEAEQHRLAIDPLDGHGEVPGAWEATVARLDTADTWYVGPGHNEDLRVPPGEYLVTVSIYEGRTPDFEGDTALYWLLSPTLTVDGPVTLAAHAADTREVTVTAPDPAAGLQALTGSFQLSHEGGPEVIRWTFESGGKVPFHTAQLSEPAPSWELKSQMAALLVNGDTEYHSHDERDGFYTGLRKEIAQRDLGEIITHLGTPTPGEVNAWLYTWPVAGSGRPLSTETALPRTRQVFVEGHELWNQQLLQSTPAVSNHVSTSVPAAPGESYEHTLGTGVFGPSLGIPGAGLHRAGDRLTGRINALSDGAGHEGYTDPTAASSVLYVDGEERHRADVVIDEIWDEFTMVPQEAEYRLVTSFSRDPGLFPVSTEITADFTFVSARSTEEQELPVSMVRFTPGLALDSTAPSGAGFAVPLVIQGAALDNGVDSLTVEVSLDGGESWAATPVEDGAVTVDNPAAGGSVSLRAALTDGDGNAVTVTVIDAYRTA